MMAEKLLGGGHNSTAGAAVHHVFSSFSLVHRRSPNQMGSLAHCYLWPWMAQMVSEISCLHGMLWHLQYCFPHQLHYWSVGGDDLETERYFIKAVYHYRGHEDPWRCLYSNNT